MRFSYGVSNRARRGRRARVYRNWALLLSVAAVLTALLTLSDARGATLAGFEIDAEMASPGNALYGQG